MIAETGRAFLLSAGRRAAFRLNCVTGGGVQEACAALQLFAPPKM